MEAVKQIHLSGLPARPHPNLNKGDRVLLADGPLRGITGLIAEVGENCRLVVSVTLLQRSVAVEIERGWAVKAPQSAAPRTYAGTKGRQVSHRPALAG
jgi:hypothetical protein